MRFLLDTDHISVLQQQSGLDFAILDAKMAAFPPSDFTFSIVS